MAQLKSGSQMNGSTIATTQQIPTGGVPTGQTYQMGVGGITYSNINASSGQNFNFGTNSTRPGGQLANVNTGTWRNLGPSIAVRYAFNNDNPSYFHQGEGRVWVRTA